VTSAPFRLKPYVACVVAAGFLVACSQQTPGDGSPTPSSSPSTPGSSASGAPKVANPKNLKNVPACQLLSSSQLQDLGATAAPKTSKSLWGEDECQWINDDISIYLSPDTTQDKGLAIVYANMAGSSSFQQLTVSGYPAVRTEKQDISCSISIGTSDTQLFMVDLTVTGVKRANHDDPCALSEKVAADVLSNLPAGQ
jgi:Protein of unknown function (DUF3558)